MVGSRWRRRAAAALPEGAVARYYGYQVTLSQGFVVPVVVEYLVAHHGLSYTAFGTTGAVFMAAWVLGELPAGYVGDLVGRRASLVAASLLTTAALVTLGLGRTLPAFVAAYLLWALGVAFRSGAGSAWLYDALASRLDGADAADDGAGSSTDDPSAFTRVKGRGWAVRLTTTAGASVAGAWLATVDWRAPFLVNAGLVALGVPVLVTFPADGEAPDDEDSPSPREVLGVIRRQFSRPPLRGFVLYMALFFGAIETTLSYVQPVSTGLGVPVAGLGWLYAGLSLVGALAGYLADDVTSRLGERTWFLAAPPAVAVLLVAVAFVPPLALPAFFAVRFVRSLTTTVRSQYLNDRVGSVARATLLSAASMVFGLTAAGARQVGGLVADATSALTLVAVSGAAFLVGTAVVFGLADPLSRAGPVGGAQPAD